MIQELPRICSKGPNKKNWSQFILYQGQRDKKVILEAFQTRQNKAED